MALVLGAAFGPQATDVEVRDATSGELVSSGRARHRDLGADVDDPSGWWRSLVAAVAAAGERDIAAVSLCGGHPGLVLLDGAGAVLRPIVPWADADLSADAARLVRSLGAEAWAHDAGALPATTTAATRLAWLRRSEPGTFARIGTVLLPHDWLTYRLSGRAVTDRGSASLTGAWSPRTDRWLLEVLGAIAPDAPAEAWYDRLPDVLGPTDRADWLTAPVFELLGLRGRPLVAPGTGHAMAVALAVGIVPGCVGVSLTGTATMLAGLEWPITDTSGAVRSRADASGGHLAVSTAPGGAGLVDAVADLLDVDVDRLSELALDAEARPDGVLVVPGVPGRPGGVLTGVSVGTGRAAVARSAFEGVACSVLDGLDQMVAAGAPWNDDEPLRLVGPAAGLATHAQVLATLADRPVMPAPDPHLAAAGACIQAAAVLHREAPDEIADAWQLGVGPLVEPLDEPARDELRRAHTEERDRQRRALARAR